MRYKLTMQTEASKVRRVYYYISLVLVVFVFIVFASSHFAALKRQEDETVARLEATVLNTTKAYLKDAVDRTISEIDLERRLVREEMGVTPGDAEAERRADEIVRSRMIVRIRETRLKDNGYLWVNEVVDFAGGPRYARRLVHGFLPETEGMMLSTEVIENGSNPYLAELEGVVRDGETYTSYYFAKPGEQIPSPKLSYARLYPDFSWIVATGAYLDDLDKVVAIERKLAEANHNERAASSVFSLLLALLSVVVLVIVVDQVTSKTIAASYKRILATEKALREEKHKVEEAYSLMKELAERDELTGLRNRRSGMNRLMIEAARANRSASPFCVAIGDIDLFKAFNDTYGHGSGDKVLKKAAATMENKLRLEDMAARWGGEEFLLLLSGDDLSAAMEATDRIRLAVSTEYLEAKGAKIRISMTFGVAEYVKDERPEDLIARADAAMYRGKAAGRDVVVAAEPPMPTS
jgi:diguanylate cyclase (GGDEF)-like protein